MANEYSDADPRYEETTHPENPPNSVLKPKARTGWLLSSVGTLVAVLMIVGAAFTWVLVRHELGKDARTYPDPQTAGTSGEQQAREDTPGGFSPLPDYKDTRDELKFKGAEDLTDLGDLKDAAVGTRVTLANVTVDSTDGSTFWIRDGDATAAVNVPGGVPTVKAGQRVDVAGTIESAGANTRIRASRIDVK